MNFNLTFVLQIINLSLSLYFLKKYFFNFILEIFDLEEQRIEILKTERSDVLQSLNSIILKKNNEESSAVLKIRNKLSQETFSRKIDENAQELATGNFLFKSILNTSTPPNINSKEVINVVISNLTTWAHK